MVIGYKSLKSVTNGTESKTTANFPLKVVLYLSLGVDQEILIVHCRYEI